MYIAARDADLSASGLDKPALKKRLGLTNVLSEAQTEVLTNVNNVFSYEIPYFDVAGKRTTFSRWKMLSLADEPPFKYYQKPKTIPRIYVPPLLDWESIAVDVSQRIILTEGEKKAACGCSYDMPTLGLGGVWNWKSRRWGLDKIPDFDQFDWTGREVEVCFDGDMYDNEDVRRACDSLLAMLVKKGSRAFVRYLPNTDGKAALDDFLVAYGVDRYQELDCHEWSRVLVDSPKNPLPNARRILRDMFDHTDRELLVHQGNSFYRWNGACWPELEDGALRSALYKWGEDKVYLKETGNGVVQEPFAPDRGKVSNLIDALRGVTFMESEAPVPAWFDERSKPSASEVISCENGLLHWPTRELHLHTPMFYCRYSVPFAFEHKAAKPGRWLAFLGQLWPKDQESIRTLQEIFGYMISGDTRLHKMFLIVGPKRGGKGTIGRVLTAVLGKHNVAGPTLASIGGEFGLWPMVDKPVAIVSDARLGGKTDGSVITERLLSISGEDTLSVNRKNRSFWTGKLPTRILMLSNELPRFTDSSGAIASRFLVLQLDESFYGRENVNLTEELCQELPGIFNWALDGLKKLRERGHFVQPRRSRDAIREMEDLGSPVMSFVRECCAIGPTEWATPDDLFKRWRIWCVETGHQAGAKETFGKNLKAAMPEIRRGQRGTGKNKKWVHIGIGLKEKRKTRP